MPPRESRRKRRPWIVAGAVVLLLIPVGILGVPILLHQNSGVSVQQPSTVPWPVEATSAGGDGRDRSFVVSGPDGAAVDTSALTVGERIVVKGAGFDGTRGIYVAICVIPADPSIKPGPCIGGVPDQVTDDAEVGTVQYAPSNWVNDDWAWKLFGARSYDDAAAGTFTAYLEVGEPSGENFDCAVDACGIFTRNDHTALNDRVQDLYVPVAFAPR
ncbi:MAG: hypothetical protein Q8M65_08425 [Rhodoglobus sp.]|nr:hypothetical protein [Rhodoglobus sp.]